MDSILMTVFAAAACVGGIAYLASMLRPVQMPVALRVPVERRQDMRSRDMRRRSW
ncbi:hypothetical protein AQS8620_01654 [Aquimixticola soesokkakensis]|uniref:Uncharacterized protein n=1 Tax=Aquimixticola soesokkakensis TaxID=1519096 RepID=A0A1Y5SJ13_9RHOB|nr:hypothetical protein [Aquimixticola soesokkakensis]SLN41945.1 hypothetical protein AQS8620_01654 [Aquimixticola soesokkakensis]